MSRIWDALQNIEEARRQDAGGARNGMTDSKPTLTALAEAAAPPPLPHSADVAHAVDPDYETIEISRSETLSRVICHTDPNSPAAESFKLLRMRLREVRSAANVRTIVVTSALPEDGKTTTSLNLATVLAEQRQQRVLLIDADLRRASIGAQLGISARPGLSECLQERLSPLSAIRRIEPMGWHLLSAGLKLAGNAAELVRLQGLSSLLQGISSKFDWIVIDSPPVLVFTDGISIAQAADGVLLVARAGRTPKKAIEDALAAIGKTQVVGFVLNGIQKADQPYERHYAYYRSRTSITAEETPLSLT